MDDSFYTELSKAGKNYDGIHKHAIKSTPEIYKLLCSLFTSQYINPKTRADILTVIGYFIIPEDIMNEKILGPKGFIDDFLLAVSFLKKIEIDYDHETISQHWDSDIDLHVVLNDYFDLVKKDYIYEYHKIKELLPTLFTYS